MLYCSGTPSPRKKHSLRYTSPFFFPPFRMGSTAAPARTDTAGLVSFFTAGAAFQSLPTGRAMYLSYSDRDVKG